MAAVGADFLKLAEAGLHFVVVVAAFWSFCCLSLESALIDCLGHGYGGSTAMCVCVRVCL